MSAKRIVRVGLYQTIPCANAQGPIDNFTHIWVDGSSRNLDGGIGVVIVRNSQVVAVFGQYVGKNCSNNVAEICAIRKGLELGAEFNSPVKVYSDSSYAINSLARTFNGPKNRPLIEDAIKYISEYPLDIELIKVKGHSDLTYNVLADHIAATMLPPLK